MADETPALRWYQWRAGMRPFGIAHPVGLALITGAAAFPLGLARSSLLGLGAAYRFAAILAVAMFLQTWFNWRRRDG